MSLRAGEAPVLPLRAPSGGSSGDSGVGTPPSGKVGIFVAAGHGARTLISCDDGRTWVANHQYEDVDADHSEFTEKGLAYGNGVFLELIGWGKPSTVKRSTNGVDWTRHPVESGNGGLVYLTSGPSRFLTTGGWSGCSTSLDGETWTRCADESRPSYKENVREVNGGEAFVGMGGDLRVLLSFDGGGSWANTPECDLTGGFGNLGQEGGFASGNGVQVVVGQNGDYCQTDDAGETWTTGDLDGAGNEKGVRGKLAFLGGEFWAPAGAKAYRSSTGTDWEEVTFQPEGTIIHAMAQSSETGTYVGLERVKNAAAHLYWSLDGETWNLVTGPSGPTLRRIVFGFADASETCPAK